MFQDVLVLDGQVVRGRTGETRSVFPDEREEVCIVS